MIIHLIKKKKIRYTKRAEKRRSQFWIEIMLVKKNEIHNKNKMKKKEFINE